MGVKIQVCCAEALCPCASEQRTLSRGVWTITSGEYNELIEMKWAVCSFCVATVALVDAG